MSCTAFLFLDEDGVWLDQARFESALSRLRPRIPCLARTGGLIFYRYSYRVESVTQTGPTGDRRSSTLSDDKEARVAMTWDFCDSTRGGWRTLTPEALFQAAVRDDLRSISVFPLELRDSQALHDELVRVCPSYLGAVEVDPGNPHQTDLLWSWLLRWKVFHLKSVGEAEESDQTIEFPPGTHHLSTRGIQSQRVIETRTKGTLGERVAMEIAAGRPSPVPVMFLVGKDGDGTSIELEKKLRTYCLDPNGPGKDKAAVFKTALGIEAQDWRFLAAQLTHHLETVGLEKVHADEYGIRYSAAIPVLGINGEVRLVQTGWISRPLDGVSSSGQISLITAYVPAQSQQTEVPSEAVTGIVVRRGAGAPEFEMIHKIAWNAAEKAASAWTPAPMLVRGNVIPEGLCGNARVIVRDARRGYAKWLKGGGLGRYIPGSGVSLLIHFGDQSFEKAREAASAYARILRLNQIECKVEALLD